MVKTLKLFCSRRGWAELAMRLAMSILRDRAAASMASLGFTRNEHGMWTKVREDTEAIGGSKMSSSYHESTVIKNLVDSAVKTMYPKRTL